MSRLPSGVGTGRDTGASDDSPPPRRCYIVCSSQRSGSSLLCQTLTDARIAGTPTEYFNADVRGALTGRWGCSADLASYLEALLARRTSPAGVFGTKLHWDQFEQLRAEALGLGRAEPEFEIPDGFLKDLFGAPLLYVHVLRRDVNRQAVSFWKALRTGVWSAPDAAADGSAEVEYSFEGIDRCRRLIENAELHWDRYFRFNGIEPYEVVYEDLEAAYAETIETLVRHLVPDAGEVRAAPARSRRLGDEHSEALLQRFACDREARGLDNPLVAPAQANGRAAELERELAILTSSRSWRLTRPLRTAGTLARRAAARR